MPRQDHSPVTDEQREAFLAELAEGCSIAEAAERAGRNRQTFYRLRDSDPAFGNAWAEAYEHGTDLLEAEAQRRAVDGVEDVKVIGQGDHAQVVNFRRYSDTLLIFLLKARRPGKFRDNVKVEHSGPAGGAIEVEHRGVSLDDILTVARETGVRPADPDG